MKGLLGKKRPHWTGWVLQELKIIHLLTPKKCEPKSQNLGLYVLQQHSFKAAEFASPQLRAIAKHVLTTYLTWYYQLAGQ